MRKILPIPVLLLFLLPRPTVAAGQEEVDTAIRRGAEWLKAEVERRQEAGEDPTREQTYGEQVLAILALLKAGLAPDDPLIDRVMDPYRERLPEHVYVAGLTAMVWSDLDRQEEGANRERKRLLETLATRIAEGQAENGSWPYSINPNTPRSGRDPIQSWRYTNISCAQYALLGLQAARNREIRIPGEVWEKTARFFIDGLMDGGQEYGPAGWGYFGFGDEIQAEIRRRKEAGQSGRIPLPNPEEHVYGSMTAVGVASLAMCKENLRDRRLVRDAEQTMQRGMDWLAANFAVDAHPGIAERAGGQTNRYLYYWLYSIERACVFAGTDTVGEANWYGEGADFLIGAQQADGSWQNELPVQEPQIAATAFAVLFLTKAAQGFLNDYEVAPLEGE